MNRVCLSGWFVDRPTLSYSPCGLAVAELRLAVPRSRPYGAPKGASPPEADLVPCVATGTLAVALYTWGEPRVRVELEGRLAVPPDASPPGPAAGESPERTDGAAMFAGALVVHADHARVLDDPLGCLDPDGPREAASLVLAAPLRAAA